MLVRHHENSQHSRELRCSQLGTVSNGAGVSYEGVEDVARPMLRFAAFVSKWTEELDFHGKATAKNKITGSSTPGIACWAYARIRFVDVGESAAYSCDKVGLSKWAYSRRELASRVARGIGVQLGTTPSEVRNELR